MISKISIFLLAFSSLLFPQKDLKVLSSNQNSITIEYTPAFIDTSLRLIDGQPFRNIELAYGSIDISQPVGVPAVPERRLVIGVPSEFGNSIKILNSVYKEFSGRVVPIPSMEKEKVLDGEKYEIKPDYYNYVDFP